MRNMGVRKERPGKRAFFLFLLILLEATLHGETRQEDVSTSFDLLETEYVVTVNLSLQEVTVFRDGRTVRSMVCSSGIPTGDNGTPTGRYIIDESGKKRGEWFFSRTYGTPPGEEGFSSMKSGRNL